MTTDDRPAPGTEPEPVQNRRLRTLLTAQAGVLLLTPTAALIMHRFVWQDRKGLGEFVFDSVKFALSVCLIATVLAFLLPPLTRRFGLPDTGTGDERERAIGARAGLNAWLAADLALIAGFVVGGIEYCLWAALACMAVQYGSIIFYSRTM